MSTTLHQKAPDDARLRGADDDVGVHTSRRVFNKLRFLKIAHTLRIASDNGILLNTIEKKTRGTLETNSFHI